MLCQAREMTAGRDSAPIDLDLCFLVLFPELDCCQSHFHSLVLCWCACIVFRDQWFPPTIEAVACVCRRLHPLAISRCAVSLKTCPDSAQLVCGTHPVFRASSLSSLPKNLNKLWFEKAGGYMLQVQASWWSGSSMWTSATSYIV